MRDERERHELVERIASSGVYLVTDRAASRSRTDEEIVEAALAGGVGAVQLRMKEATSRERFAVAQRLLASCRAARVPLFINDDVGLALAVGADGVHIGQEDLPAREVRRIIGPRMLLGVTAALPALAREAEAAGADYVGVGAMFPTSTKEETLDTGLAGLRAVRAAVSLPIVAIGGIDTKRAGVVIASGASIVAVVKALVGVDDVRAATMDLVDAVRRARLERKRDAPARL